MAELRGGGRRDTSSVDVRGLGSLPRAEKLLAMELRLSDDVRKIKVGIVCKVFGMPASAELLIFVNIWKIRPTSGNKCTKTAQFREHLEKQNKTQLL